MSAALARRQVLGRVKAIGDGCLCFSPVTQLQQYHGWKDTRSVGRRSAAGRGVVKQMEMASLSLSDLCPAGVD